MRELTVGPVVRFPGTTRPYIFPERLERMRIMARPNRFIIVAEDDNGEQIRVHCPSTGRIGRVNLGGLPLLVSRHRGGGRRTDRTAEAISYDDGISWIGINQAASNRYVGHFLRENGLRWMVRGGKYAEPERRLGDSRIDFRVGDTYIEVKTPVQVIQKTIPAGLEVVENPGRLSGGERLVRHIRTLGESLSLHQRAIMLNCFQYIPDEDAADRYDNGDLYSDASVITEAFNRSLALGVECWTACFEVTPEAVYLRKYWRDAPG